MTKYSGGIRANNESTALAKIYIVSVTSKVQSERLLQYVRHIHDLFSEDWPVGYDASQTASGLVLKGCMHYSKRCR